MWPALSAARCATKADAQLSSALVPKSRREQVAWLHYFLVFKFDLVSRRWDANTSSKWDSITATVSEAFMRFFFFFFPPHCPFHFRMNKKKKSLKSRRRINAWKAKDNKCLLQTRGWKDKKTQFARLPWRAWSPVLSTSPEPLFSLNSLHISPFSIWWQARGGSTCNCSKAAMNS